MLKPSANPDAVDNKSPIPPTDNQSLHLFLLAIETSYSSLEDLPVAQNLAQLHVPSLFVGFATLSMTSMALRRVI